MPEMSTLNKLTSMYLLDFEFVDGIAFVNNSCIKARGFQLRQTTFTNRLPATLL